METTLLKPKTKTPNSFKGGHGPYFALHHDERIQQALDRYFEANPSHTLECRYIDSGSHYVIIAEASILDSNGQQICQALAVGDDPFITERSALIAILNQLKA